MNRAWLAAMLGAIVAGTVGTAPASIGVGAGSRELRDVIDGNRMLLNDIRMEICYYQDGENAIVQRDLWAVSGGKFFHETSHGATNSQEGRQEFHQARASDGRFETHALYHRDQGFVQKTWPRAADHPAVSPWRLFGIAGMGFEDPVSWLDQEGIVVTDNADGRVRLEIPGKALPVAVGHSMLTYRPYAKRTVVFDVRRGGVVLSLEDRDESGRLLQELQNADFRRSERGAWYPGKTVLTKYANGQIIKRSTSEIATLRHLSPGDEGCFKVGFPRGVTVTDHTTGLMYTVGDVNDSLSIRQFEVPAGEVRPFSQVGPAVARPAEAAARPDALLHNAELSIQDTLPVASRAARTHESERKRGGWILILAVAAGVGLLAVKMGVFRKRARPRSSENG